MSDYSYLAIQTPYGQHLHINIFLVRVYDYHFLPTCSKTNHQYIIIFTVIHLVLIQHVGCWVLLMMWLGTSTWRDNYLPLESKCELSKCEILLKFTPLMFPVCFTDLTDGAVVGRLVPGPRPQYCFFAGWHQGFLHPLALLQCPQQAVPDDGTTIHPGHIKDYELKHVIQGRILWLTWSSQRACDPTLWCCVPCSRRGAPWEPWTWHSGAYSTHNAPRPVCTGELEKHRLRFKCICSGKTFRTWLDTLMLCCTESSQQHNTNSCESFVSNK